MGLGLRHAHLRRVLLATLSTLAFLIGISFPAKAPAAERIKLLIAILTGTDPDTGEPYPAGSLAREASGTTTWYLYPGACSDRANGTWAPRSSPQADSLNTYPVGTTGPYGVLDESLHEILWHVSDNGTCTPGVTCPPALGGSRMLWCGKYDPSWVVPLGYPNFTYQILYLDTGAHATDYNLILTYNFSSESSYDNAYLIGGGGDAVDPIGNSRATLDATIASGGALVRWSGSVTPAMTGATGGSTTGGTLNVLGSPSGPPATVTGASFTIAAEHRALYFVFITDCFVSSEDGLWPEGLGVQLDNISTSDNGSIYTDEAAAGGTDAYSGMVIKGTPGSPIISARVPPGVGTLWQLVQGNNLPTPDTCSPKNTSTDLIFEGGNASTFHTVPNVATSVVSCTFPIPVGTGSVAARWSEYLDMPRYSGYVQFAEYRCFKDGSWSNWRNTDGGGTRRVENAQAWATVRSELAEATQADSVQMRYSIRCVPEITLDGQTCGDVVYGVLYDNFRLEVTTGVPRPVFGVYPGFLAQSTFVDGTIAGTACAAGTVTAGQCWPGPRGSDNGLPAAIHDNFNSPLGDSIVISIQTGIRRNGKGINWHHGFDRSVNAGLSIAHTNPNFVAAFDKPRVIFRLFDPATKTWSPFDSSELDANSVSVAGSDTVLIDSKFRMNWPPRDRASASLPGGFTLNGKSLYSQLAFLPRGTRLQYYFKGVDIHGGVSYQFRSDMRAGEVEDLPILPGSSLRAPDILEYDVLPGAYLAGPGGTLVAGRTNTPILNLDGAYTAWTYFVDPLTQALRALGVRADRYRMLQGTEQGGNLGGHELAGTRVGRLGNFFPNMEEYGIKDSLAAWYRIMIESTHTRGSFSLLEESDSKLLREWWESPSPGTDGGDRCLLTTGDDCFTGLLTLSGLHPYQTALANQVFGVAAAANQWNGGSTVAFPSIRDLFADPASGPGLGIAGAYAYTLDGGCPAPNRFDALTKSGSSDAQNAALYPTFSGVTNVAGVSNMTDRDLVTDHDRNKALGYGFSIQFIRQGGENLVDARAQVLYKFLASCRGPRTVSDTASCWPCPTDANKYGNWATLSGFQTGTYGPLYAIQDGTRALTGVEQPAPAPRFANSLSQNRPNPFNPETLIPYSLATRGRVRIRIYDVSGRCVRTLVDAIQDVGIHRARWTGELDAGGKAASSIYFYRITYPDGTASAKKMVILR